MRSAEVRIDAEVPMNCPKCGEELRWDGGTISTLVGYYGPPGHDHDDNCLTREYICSNGHVTKESIRRTCPVPGCDWKGKKDCFCNSLPPKESWYKGVISFCHDACRKKIPVTDPLPHHHVGDRTHPGLMGCQICADVQNLVPKVEKWSEVRRVLA